MTKMLCRALAFLVFATTAFAQTVTVSPVSVANKLAWEQTGPSTVTEAQSFEPRVRIDGVLIPVVTTETCVTVTSPAPLQWTCVLSLNAAMVTALNVRGTHQVVLRLYDPVTMLESPDSVPFVLSSPPAAPTGTRIIR